MYGATFFTLLFHIFVLSSTLLLDQRVEKSDLQLHHVFVRLSCWLDADIPFCNIFNRETPAVGRSKYLSTIYYCVMLTPFFRFGIKLGNVLWVRCSASKPKFITLKKPAASFPIGSSIYVLLIQDMKLDKRRYISQAKTKVYACRACVILFALLFSPFSFFHTMCSRWTSKWQPDSQRSTLRITDVFVTFVCTAYIATTLFHNFKFFKLISASPLLERAEPA